MEAQPRGSQLSASPTGRVRPRRANPTGTCGPSAPRRWPGAAGSRRAASRHRPPRLRLRGASATGCRSPRSRRCCRCARARRCRARCRRSSACRAVGPDRRRPRPRPGAGPAGSRARRRAEGGHLVVLRGGPPNPSPCGRPGAGHRRSPPLPTRAGGGCRSGRIGQRGRFGLCPRRGRRRPTRDFVVDRPSPPPAPRPALTIPSAPASTGASRDRDDLDRKTHPPRLRRRHRGDGGARLLRAGADRGGARHHRRHRRGATWRCCASSTTSATRPGISGSCAATP